jgi:hypothetical protein
METNVVRKIFCPVGILDIGQDAKNLVMPNVRAVLAQSV